jgi:hypothetical protein
VNGLLNSKEFRIGFLSMGLFQLIFMLVIASSADV